MKIPVTFSKYIGRHFLLSVGVVFLSLMGLIVLFDSMEMIRRTQNKDVPFTIVMEMVLMKAPTIIQEVIPFAILLGGILSFARLTRSSELIVARAAGVSVWQFLSPVVISAFIIGVLVMAVFNPLASAMLSRFEKIEAKYLHGNASMLAVSSTGLWLRQINSNEGKTIIHALRVANDDMRLHEVTFYLYDNDNIFKRRVDAQSAELKEGHWQINDAILTQPGAIPSEEANYHLRTNLSTHQIQESFAPPETMSFWELPEFINNLKAAGFSALKHSLHWHSILVTPFLLSAMVFFAAAFSMRLPRKGRTGLLMTGGILAGFLIRFLSDVVGALGLSGSIPVVMAAWAPVGISMLLGIALLLHLEDG